jgi:hypothetical protein
MAMAVSVAQPVTAAWAVRVWMVLRVLMGPAPAIPDSSDRPAVMVARAVAAAPVA